MVCDIHHLAFMASPSNNTPHDVLMTGGGLLRPAIERHPALVVQLGRQHAQELDRREDVEGWWEGVFGLEVAQPQLCARKFPFPVMQNILMVILAFDYMLKSKTVRYYDRERSYIEKLCRLKWVNSRQLLFYTASIFVHIKTKINNN